MSRRDSDRGTSMTGRPGGYDSVAELVETLDQQVRFYQGLPDDRLLVGLPQLLLYLESDARQFALIRELRDESQRALVDFEEQGKKLRMSLAEFWREAVPLLRAARALSEDEEFDASDDFDGFERNLVIDEEIDSKAFLYRGEPSDDPRLIKGLLSKLDEWISSAMRAHRRVQSEAPDLLKDLDGRLQGLRREMEFGYRRFWLEARALSGNAYERLKYTADWINPVPRPQDISEGWEHAGHEYLNKNLVEALYVLSQPPSGEAQRSLMETAVKVRRDIALVHLQLRSRMVMTHSNLGLLKRFAARCERFDAELLRKRALSNSKSAENELRGELARFLFDHGLNPLLDSTIAGLRPDVLDVRLGKPVYVEAKRYGAKKEREQFIKGFRQVLDTRGRLCNILGDLREVFLAVFRLVLSIRSPFRVAVNGLEGPGEGVGDEGDQLV
jgi:hypothetical protein